MLRKPEWKSAQIYNEYSTAKVVVQIYVNVLNTVSTEKI